MASFGFKKKWSSITVNVPPSIDTASDVILHDEISCASTVSPLCRPRFRRSAKTTSGKNDTMKRGSSVPKSLGCGVATGNGCDAKGDRSPTSGGSLALPAAHDRRASGPTITGTKCLESGDVSPKSASSGSITLEPRIMQYERSELLQDRSPETGLSELESFLLEKQQQLDAQDEGEETGRSGQSRGLDTEDDGRDTINDNTGGLVPRAPFYQPHPLLQIRTEVGMTELEMYLLEKEATDLQSVPDTDTGDASGDCVVEWQ